MNAKTYRKNGEIAELHTDDIKYTEAPLPRRWHRCKPWSVYLLPTGMVDCCACGATRLRLGGWRKRNSRRKVKW